MERIRKLRGHGWKQDHVIKDIYIKDCLRDFMCYISKSLRVFWMFDRVQLKDVSRILACLLSRNL